MDIISDNSGQGSAEYILLFGAIIVIAIAALAIYRGYFNPGVNPFRASTDLNIVRTSVT
jgi:uncharacterized protein (UPF0333 family)